MTVSPVIESYFPYRISIIILNFKCNISKHGPLDLGARLAWEDVMEQFEQQFLERNPEVDKFNMCWATSEDNADSLFILCCKYLTHFLFYIERASLKLKRQSSCGTDHSCHWSCQYQLDILSRSIKSLDQTLQDSKRLWDFLISQPRVLHTQWHRFAPTLLVWPAHGHVDLLKVNVSRKALILYPPDQIEANMRSEDHAIDFCLPSFAMPDYTQRTVADRMYTGHYVELPPSDGDEDDLDKLRPVREPDLFCEVVAWCWEDREVKKRAVKKAGFRGDKWDTKLKGHMQEMARQGKAYGAETWSLNMYSWPLVPRSEPREESSSGCCTMQ